MNYPETLKITENIAREAGNILMTHYGKTHNIKYKSPGDVVTEADVASEEYITKRLKSEFPSDTVLGEEFGLSETELESDFCWAIDPLDGTANYAMHFPIFAVSIGLSYVKVIQLLGSCMTPTTTGCFVLLKDTVQQ